MHSIMAIRFFSFFFQAEDGIRDRNVTGVQTCALPIWLNRRPPSLFLVGIAVVIIISPFIKMRKFRISFSMLRVYLIPIRITTAARLNIIPPAIYHMASLFVILPLFKGLYIPHTPQLI